jgi:hypothetical protein
VDKVPQWPRQEAGGREGLSGRGGPLSPWCQLLAWLSLLACSQAQLECGTSLGAPPAVWEVGYQSPSRLPKGAVLLLDVQGEEPG